MYTNITLEAICKEFDIRAEDVFAFMDDQNIHIGGSLMHDISIDLPDFRKFIEYRRRQLKDTVEKANRDLDQLDDKAENFLRAQKGW
jgi:hypothetical protein